jgi:hypothetical protein
MTALSSLDGALHHFEKELQELNVPILIGIDEPQSLDLGPEGVVDRKAYLQTRKGLSRVFALVERYHRNMRGSVSAVRWHIFFPLLSTQGRMSDLTTPELTLPSTRDMAPIMLDPFIAFPFDVFATEKKELATLEDCQNIENLAYLGRPLYASPLIRASLDRN